MRFHVASHLEYVVKSASTLILNVHAQRNSAQTIVHEKFTVTPKVSMEEFDLENEGNRFVRLEIKTEKTIAVDYSATVDCASETLPARGVEPISIFQMDGSTIPYLFPSRYCQSDRLGKLAWDLFGTIADPYQKVIAVDEWIHANVEYALGTTNSETSACDTVVQRVGVCRDFAHLGIALCRALNIPARYFSGYAYQLDPPNFHACFECFIGGQWLIFDATRLVPLNGLVRIGTGRDAADAAVASIYGRAQGTAMKVDCQLAPGEKFTSLRRGQLNSKGLSLDSATVAPAN